MAYDVAKETLASLRPEWEGLLEQHPAPMPFYHPAWQQVWLEEFQGDRELFLLSVRDGGALVGVAPLLREDGRLSLVGHYSICDYMDFVVAPECGAGFFSAIMGALQDEAWSEIELRGLHEGSATLAELPALAEGAGFAFEREEEALAPSVQLLASWDEQVASLSKKYRHELRRKLRRLEAAGNVELVVHTAPGEIESQMPLLLRFMVESRTDKASFLSEQMGRFFHRMTQTMAEAGMIRLFVLELDAQPVAAVLCFDYGGRLMLYNSGYDPQYASLSVGLVSKALCMRDAIEIDRHCVDFLRGDEPYKYGLGAEDQTIFRCLVKRT